MYLNLLLTYFVRASFHHIVNYLESFNKVAFAIKKGNIFETHPLF